VRRNPSWFGNGVRVLGISGQGNRLCFRCQGFDSFETDLQRFPCGLRVDELNEDFAGTAITGRAALNRGVGALYGKDLVSEISAEHLDRVVAWRTINRKRVIAD